MKGDGEAPQIAQDNSALSTCSLRCQQVSQGQSGQQAAGNGALGLEEKMASERDPGGTSVGMMEAEGQKEENQGKHPKEVHTQEVAGSSEGCRGTRVPEKHIYQGGEKPQPDRSFMLGNPLNRGEWTRGVTAHGLWKGCSSRASSTSLFLFLFFVTGSC